MTKIETVSSLPRSVSSLSAIEQSLSEINKELQSLPAAIEQSLSEINKELQSLPAAIAQETAISLKEIHTGAQVRVTKTVEDLTARQARLIDEVTKELSRSTSKQISKQAAILEQEISEWRVWSAQMKDSVTEIDESLGEARELPKRIKTAIDQLRSETTRLKNVTGGWIGRALTILIAAALGAVLALTGQHVFDRLLPPSDLQQTAVWANAIWSKATQKEKELLKQIVERREK